MSIVVSESDQTRVPIDELCIGGVILADMMESGCIPETCLVHPEEEEEERIESSKRERESSPDSPDEDFGDEESPQQQQQQLTKVAHVEKEEGEVIDNDVFDREEE